jgi:hypothetical protein
MKALMVAGRGAFESILTPYVWRASAESFWVLLETWEGSEAVGMLTVASGSLNRVKRTRFYVVNRS